MEITGNLKVIDETKDIGTSGFQKRNCVVTTIEQYPQHILVQFVQDKCNLLTGFNIGDEVKIDINLRGREWTNPQGEVVYFNTIQGWRIVKVQPNYVHPGTATTAPSNTAQTQTNPSQTGTPLPWEEGDSDLPY